MNFERHAKALAKGKDTCSFSPVYSDMDTCRFCGVPGFEHYARVPIDPEVFAELAAEYAAAHPKS